MDSGYAQPRPALYKYSHLIADIEKGEIQIPKFQRDFVWDKQKSADFIDSMLKGYPIGTFILWRTKEQLNNVKHLGGQEIPSPPGGQPVQYVLDGQQRLASLFVIVKGQKVKRGKRAIDYKNIYIDLKKPYESEDIVGVTRPPGEYITVYDLLNSGIEHLAKEYGDHLGKINAFKKSLEGYDFSTILIDDYPLDKAVEVFNRINTTGKALSLFEIMVAKTYDDNSFDMSQKYKDLKKILSRREYSIPPPQLLQCISANLVKECTRKVILALPHNDIVNIWDDTIDSIKRAVDHFRNRYNIRASRILPYPALFVPFSYFFFKNDGKRPTLQQDTYLKEYFWRAALTSRFTSSVESKLAHDCNCIDAIIKGEHPHYEKELQVKLNKKDIQDLQFRIGESISNAILCVMVDAAPQSFESGFKVNLDNFHLHASNSKNYHHFFPKAFLTRQGVKPNRINLISNITLIDAELNSKIKDTRPSEYMEEFDKVNPSLEATMKTHLIDNVQNYGIYNDDYDTFIERRSARIWEELKARFDPDHGGV